MAMDMSSLIPMIMSIAQSGSRTSQGKENGFNFLGTFSQYDANGKLKAKSGSDIAQNFLNPGRFGGIWGTGEGGGGDGDDVNVEDFYPWWTKQAAAALTPWVTQYLKNFVPGEDYSGSLTTDMTPAERSGLESLNKYMVSPNTGNAFAAGKSQIMDTLGGRFADPKTSPYIKSMIELAKMNLGDEISAERARRGARGTYYTTDAINAESKIGERTQNYLNAMIGEFIQNERNNMLNAVPQAMSIDEYEMAGAPLKKITASQTLGSLERTIQSANLEKLYQDFQRKRNEMAMPIDAAKLLISPGYAGSGGTLQAPSTGGGTSDMMSSLIPMVTNLLGSYFGNKGGTNSNTITGGQGGQVINTAQYGETWSPYA